MEEEWARAKEGRSRYPAGHCSPQRLHNRRSDTESDDSFGLTDQAHGYISPQQAAQQATTHQQDPQATLTGIAQALSQLSVQLQEQQASAINQTQGNSAANLYLTSSIRQLLKDTQDLCSKTENVTLRIDGLCSSVSRLHRSITPPAMPKRELSADALIRPARSCSTPAHTAPQTHTQQHRGTPPPSPTLPTTQSPEPIGGRWATLPPRPTVKTGQSSSRVSPQSSTTPPTPMAERPPMVRNVTFSQQQQAPSPQKEKRCWLFSPRMRGSMPIMLLLQIANLMLWAAHLCRQNPTCPPNT